MSSGRVGAERKAISGLMLTWDKISVEQEHGDINTTVRREGRDRQCTSLFRRGKSRVWTSGLQGGQSYLFQSSVKGSEGSVNQTGFIL